MTNSRCYLCKSQELKQRPGKVRDNAGLKILECNSCGLVFLSSFEHIGDNFYKKSGMHEEGSLNIQNWIKETEADDERRFEYLKPVLANCSLLDFGCGTGNFLMKARNLAGQVHGIELESRLRSYFQQNNLTVFTSLSDIPKKRCLEGYDIITMFHVLEHIQDPKSLLSELSEILATDGQIIVEVPNADDALLTLYHNEAFSNFTYWSCHLFLFNTKTLEMLACQAGLHINYIKQIQRYPLANHLFWLAQHKAGGHKRWHFMNSAILNTAYEQQLAAIGKCDTILMSLSV